MKEANHIVIAGAGGIAEAVGLLLAEWSEKRLVLYLGNRTFSKAKLVAEWIKTNSTKDVQIEPFTLLTEPDQRMKEILDKGQVLLDCLPGSLAPKMALLAKNHQLHYVNLTEYVQETEQIKEIAKDASTAFVLQSGLAPGYINVLAHHLYKSFCEEFKVEKAIHLEMKVGALTEHAMAPYFYGFTWSPVGVATEYIKDAIVVRNHEVVNRPSLSERKRILIHGLLYEEDLTSGGAADLPEALKDKVENIDYKTLRFPGHYQWVEEQLKTFKSNDKIADLQKKMESVIPHLEEDQVVVFAAVQGNDEKGVLRRKEFAKIIKPQKVGKAKLRAIQTTTAAPMVESAMWLLKENKRGPILQSELDTQQFLNGNCIAKIYGKIEN
ncbi:saccharopine dehydrogenase family protein [Namhaeicola litoreus]|uniref:Saccharopine dehydrogenase family protein n=1 Tax=Namhaeicola litoreus TaxID=1052145 RepID=A0ABW3XWR4_9FLAO